jgi:hypothetical protein
MSKGVFAGVTGVLLLLLLEPQAANDIKVTESATVAATAGMTTFLRMELFFLDRGWLEGF